MKEITLSANAKINLFLDVTGKLPNGYHTISSVMHEVSLCDKVTVRENNGGIRISGNGGAMPLGEENIAYKAALEFFLSAGIRNAGAEICIEKNIPMQAGLAGGSADAAAVLRALNMIYDEIFTKEQLCDIGKRLGADVPFCIIGGCMLAEGIGEQLSPCNPLPECTIVIAKRDTFGSCTKAAYAELDKIENRPIINNNMVDLLSSGELVRICSGMHNCFELIISGIEDIKSVMINKGALGAMMSGSGTSVFGIFVDETDALKAKKELESQDICAFMCKPVRSGNF